MTEDVTLRNLDEVAAESQDTLGGGDHSRRRQRVDHGPNGPGATVATVATVALGSEAGLADQDVCKLEITTIARNVDALVANVRSLERGPGGAQDGHAPRPSDLRQGEAEATGGRVDQQRPLTFSGGVNACNAFDAVNGRQKYRREGRCLLGSDDAWHGRDELGRHTDAVLEHAFRLAKHPISDPERALGASFDPDVDDRAGKVAPHGGGVDGRGVEAHGHEEISEVERHRLDPDAHSGRVHRIRGHCRRLRHLRLCRRRKMDGKGVSVDARCGDDGLPERRRRRPRPGGTRRARRHTPDPARLGAIHIHQ